MKHLKVLRSTLRVLCSMLVLSFILSIPRPSYGANGVNKVINFQGKVTNASGTNVTDGVYDFVIKIYDGAGSGASTLFTETWSSAALWSSQMSSAPISGGESLTYSTGTNESTIKVGQILWNTTKKESVIVTSIDTGTNVIGISPTRQAWNTTDSVTNGIYIKDGVFKVAINSLNANISGVNFGTDNIFMGVEFNGDGEMKPRIQYTATPYAMNSEKVNGLTVTNTSDAAFSSTTTLKIGDGKTVQIDNGLRFTGTDSTQFTFPSGSGTVLTADSTAVLTNKSIGSGGLTFTGADIDITTGSNEHLSIIPNGTGNLGIGTTAPSAYFHVWGPAGTTSTASISARSSYAALVTDNAVGHLFVASASGIPKFIVGSNGVITGSNINADHIAYMGDNSLSVIGTFYAGAIDYGIRINGTTIATGGAPGFIDNDNVDLTLSAGGLGSIIMTQPVTMNSSLGVSGNANIVGNLGGLTGLTLTSGAITLGGVTGSGLCITGGASASWGSCGGGTNYWQRALGVVAPAEITNDLVLGGSATASALIKFSGTANQNSFINTGGNFGIGTTTPLSKLHINGATTGKALVLLNETGDQALITASQSGQTRFVIENSGNMGIYTGVSADVTLTPTENFHILSDGKASILLDADKDALGGTSAFIKFNQENASKGILGVVSNPNQDPSGTTVTGLSVDDFYLGSQNDIDFGTTNTPRLKIKRNSGNIGIGSLAPDAKLHLIGDFGTGATASISARSSFAGLVVDNTVGDLFTASSSGLNRFVISQSGSLGIGTSTPLATVDLVHADNSDGGLKLQSSLTDNTNKTGRIKSGHYDVDQAPVTMMIAQNNNNNNILNFGGASASETSVNSIRFWTGESYTTLQGTERMRIESTGNVGIGTTSPNANLHLLGSFGTDATASISARSSFAGLVVDNTVGDLLTASSSGLNRFVIKQNGNIGIGTTNPTAKLEIASGQVFLPDGSPGAPTISFSNDTNSGIYRQGNDLVSIVANGQNAFNVYGNVGGVGRGGLMIGNGSPVSRFQINDDNNDTLSGVTFGGTASTYIQMYKSGSNQLSIMGGSVGIGTSTPYAGLHVLGANATSPAASISANTNFAGLVIDNKGNGDLFTASSSGLNRFVIKQSGNVGIGLSNPQAAKFTISDSSLAPGVDLALISATTGITTTGVDGMQIDIANSGSSAITNAGLTINVTSNNTNASSNLYGVNIADLLSGGESSSEVALNIGTGWDRGIVIGSGGATNSGLVYTGAGRPTKTIILTPEYTGAILTASGSATTDGDLTSDASNSASLNYKTYFEWTSSNASLQDYTIAVRVPLPRDFSDWDTTASNAVKINFNTALTTTDSNKLDVIVYNASSGLATPVAYRQANKSATEKTWTTVTIDRSDLIDGSEALDTNGEIMMIYLKLYAKTSNYVQVGDIELNYLASF